MKITFSKRLNTLLQLQTVRFIIIGTSAAIVNYIGVVCIVELFSIKPLIANVFAYLIASLVSYFGHYHWTFSSSTQHHKSIVRFYFMLGMNLLLNEALFAFMLHMLHLDYRLGLFLTLLIIPVFTFFISKFWVYR